MGGRSQRRLEGFVLDYEAVRKKKRVSGRWFGNDERGVGKRVHGYEGALGQTYGYMQLLQTSKGGDKHRLVKLLL